MVMQITGYLFLLLLLVMLMAAYENHSRKRQTPVTDAFSTSRGGCPLNGASTVLSFWLLVLIKTVRKSKGVTAAGQNYTFHSCNNFPLVLNISHA